MFGTAQTPAFGTVGSFGSASVAPAFGTTSVAPAFGATSTVPLFGSTSAAPSLFGATGFGTTTQTTGTFGSTGTGLFSLNAPKSIASIAPLNFGTVPATTMQLTQQQPQAAISGFNSDLFTRTLAAITNPQICGDERDVIIGRFNQLQAFAGSGKGYYYSGAAPVDFTGESSFCRFKAVGYNKRLSFENKDGFVSLILKKTAEEVEKYVQLLIDGLFKVLGNKPNFSVQVDCVRPLPDSKCEVTVFVTETGPSGLKRKMLSADLANYLSYPNVRSAIASEFGVECVTAKMDLTPEQLKQYLDTPPCGIDPAIWVQAILDNPDPTRFIPVPILGFAQLRERRKQQLQQAELQKDFILSMDESVNELDYRIAQNHNRIRQCRANQNMLSHRLLQVLGKQQTVLRLGFALDATDEVLKSRLEAILIKMNSPLQCKSRLIELISQIRSQPHLFMSKEPAASDSSLSVDVETADELRLYLKRSQEVLEGLVGLIQEDSRNLKIIQEQAVL